MPIRTGCGSGRLHYIDLPRHCAGYRLYVAEPGIVAVSVADAASMYLVEKIPLG